MAVIAIHNKSGQEVGKYEIDSTELAPSINRQLLHDVVVMYQANLRLGTHRTKSRSEVAGSTKKLYRQKGTGNARVGNRRAGHRVKGGHIHAIRPRDYSYRLPKKAVQAATRMALASKIIDNQLVLIDELKFDAPRTKDMAAILKSLGLNSTTTLVATENYDPTVLKSARNIEGVTVSPVSDLNALSLLKPRRVLMTTAALDAVRAKAKAINEAKKAAAAETTEA
jgi:large subunit ribosomal protein L4